MCIPDSRIAHYHFNVIPSNHTRIVFFLRASLHGIAGIRQYIIDEDLFQFERITEYARILVAQMQMDFDVRM